MNFEIVGKINFHSFKLNNLETLPLLRGKAPCNLKGLYLGFLNIQKKYFCRRKCTNDCGLLGWKWISTYKIEATFQVAFVRLQTIDI